MLSFCLGAVQKRSKEERLLWPEEVGHMTLANTQEGGERTEEEHINSSRLVTLEASADQFNSVSKGE